MILLVWNPNQIVGFNRDLLGIIIVSFAFDIFRFYLPGVRIVNFANNIAIIVVVVHLKSRISCKNDAPKNFNYFFSLRFCRGNIQKIGSKIFRNNGNNRITKQIKR